MLLSTNGKETENVGKKASLEKKVKTKITVL